MITQLYPAGVMRPEERFLFHQGTLYHSYQHFGAHLTRENNQTGVRFTVWAPRAKDVAVVGDFNQWKAELHRLFPLEDSGIWSGFVSGVDQGSLYKYQITTAEGSVLLKADPYAFYAECPPKSASRVFELAGYYWQDHVFQEEKKGRTVYNRPLNIYEVHLGSWKRKKNGDVYNYREIAPELADYVQQMGYTHIQLLPISEHPFDGSWGYQTTGYYAPTSRYGTPHDLMYFVDTCHQKGIGVILDWVAAHFCKDGHGLACFDGDPLYEKEEIAGWGTMKFDYGRPEVKSFLISNAIFWLEVFHLDGIRMDAVASMLYLDYGKSEGQWAPNRYGGNGDLEAIAFIKHLNEVVFSYFPETLMMAEESTEWPLVSRPTSVEGLGFNYKWNMGWMNDVLKYMSKEPIHRQWHHHLLTFSFLYAFSENFILPMSHDEVVHGKRSLIEKMPGDYWQKFAHLRVFFGYMMTHPGKKLLFMGGEWAQFIEWRYYQELEWFLLDFEMHRKLHDYVRRLNMFYLNQKALWELDHGWEGFEWIDCHNHQQSILIYIRKSLERDDFLVVLCNFTPHYYEGFRIGVPRAGCYGEVFNSDLQDYGGSGKTNEGHLIAEKSPWQGQPYSCVIKVPPLAFVLFKPILSGA